MRIGSLFAGIGGFDLGFERAGFAVSWQVEKDAYCQQVLAKHWPHVPRFSDVRDCGRHNLEPVDVITGGFPCQDLSAAGKMAGLDGEQSGLWREMLRIVGEVRPRYVVMENVTMLLVRGLDRILGSLAELGYGAEWHLVQACDVGAPHRRGRIWIVADADSQGQLSETGTERKVWGRIDHSREKGERENVADAMLTRLQGFAGHECSGKESRPIDEGAIRPVAEGSICERTTSGWWDIEPDVGRVAHGVPKRMDRLKGLGNALVPQIAEMIALEIRHKATA